MKKVLIIILFIGLFSCKADYYPLRSDTCSYCRALGISNQYIIKKYGRDFYNVSRTEISETDSSYVFLIIHKNKISKDSLENLLSEIDSDSAKYSLFQKYVFLGGGPYEITISKGNCEVINFKY